MKSIIKIKKHAIIQPAEKPEPTEAVRDLAANETTGAERHGSASLPNLKELFEAELTKSGERWV
ncbi:MAG: hypothetical protein ISN29_06585 [Gammaproteobacteria bacterium AqS3]|nr:hypothetical protein [Gammaproteobacteria bacterium AqS3]